MGEQGKDYMEISDELSEFLDMVEAEEQRRLKEIKAAVDWEIKPLIPSFELHNVSYALPFQAEGTMAGYFFYLRGRYGVLSLSLAKDSIEATRHGGEFSATMETPEGEEDRDFSKRFLALASNLAPTKRLFAFPAQLRWDEGSQEFTSFGDGPLMIGPWYPKGKITRRDGSEAWSEHSAVYGRGFTEREALRDLLKDDFISERVAEAVSVAAESWGGAINRRDSEDGKIAPVPNVFAR